MLDFYCHPKTLLFRYGILTGILQTYPKSVMPTTEQLPKLNDSDDAQEFIALWPLPALRSCPQGILPFLEKIQGGHYGKK